MVSAASSYSKKIPNSDNTPTNNYGNKARKQFDDSVPKNNISEKTKVRFSAVTAHSYNSDLPTGRSSSSPCMQYTRDLKDTSVRSKHSRLKNTNDERKLYRASSTNAHHKNSTSTTKSTGYSDSITPPISQHNTSHRRATNASIVEAEVRTNNSPDDNLADTPYVMHDQNRQNSPTDDISIPSYEHTISNNATYPSPYTNYKTYDSMDIDECISSYSDREQRSRGVQHRNSATENKPHKKSSDFFPSICQCLAPESDDEYEPYRPYYPSLWKDAPPSCRAEVLLSDSAIPANNKEKSIEYEPYRPYYLSLWKDAPPSCRAEVLISNSAIPANNKEKSIEYDKTVNGIDKKDSSNEEDGDKLLIATLNILPKLLWLPKPRSSCSSSNNK